ncbi:MAG TPA: glycosyltransferase family 4 protein [Bacteroidales bacterium]|nr:glycosyltransferase family 4 protein [Bacteroidales bacterium]
MKILVLGNYPPRQCGIATFTYNLVESLKNAAILSRRQVDIGVIAMNDAGMTHAYPPIVVHCIRDDEASAYADAAHFINKSGADLLLLQHEYGIFGGESGVMLLNLLRHIRIPVVSTFHTVLEKPSFHQREVLRRIAAYSDYVVIMNSLAIGFLKEVFDVPAEKIVHIPHGVPDFEANLDKLAPRPSGWKGRKVMLTFGLIGRSKGIETVIRALPAIVAEHPDILYVVLGKTHPHVLRIAGEEYRDMLEKLTAHLHLENHVVFDNRYVDELELMSLLYHADLYVTPYLNRAQITSGTLSYAVSGGCAVFSTPYWHAEELLQQGLGILFEFQRSDMLANQVNRLLGMPDELSALQKKAFEYGTTITWPKAGLRYLDTLRLAISRKHKPVVQTIKAEYSTKHLCRLTTSTGLLEHAKGIIPSFAHGYCLDDNARAALCLLMADNAGIERLDMNLLSTYLAFVAHMQESNGSFSNYLSFSRVKHDKDFSDDAYGRAMWLIGYLICHAPCDALFQTAHEMFHRSLPHIDKLRYARGYANVIFGLLEYHQKFPDQERIIHLIKNLSDTLCLRYQQHRRDFWHWFEDALTYDNGLIPAALYASYQLLRDEKYLSVAETTRKFLESKCFINPWLSLIGNHRWLRFDSTYELFAQQPIDAFSMVAMYEQAYLATARQEFREKMLQSYAWFFGENDLNISVYDAETKGCNDGIEPRNINRNQGAESTVAYLLSTIIVRRNKLAATLQADAEA